MRCKPGAVWTASLSLLVLLAFPQGTQAQQDKVAALKQSLAANQQLQKQYKWVETTVVSMKGEEKSRTQKQCFYGPDGKVQKQPLSAPPQQAAPGGVKGKLVEKKKAEITATMTQAMDLVHQYVPPDPQRIQAAKSAGNLAVTPSGPSAARLDLKNYLKPGDTLSLGLDTAGNALQTVSVKSYLATPADAVSLDVTFARLREGLSYPGNVVLNVPGQQIQVVVQNSNYQRVAPAGAAPAQTKAAPTAAPATAPANAATSTASAAAMDTLTAPIALYPDALIAQILQASTDPAGVQKFSAWLGANASLKGTPLQDAAQAAGFAACYIALAPFGQVVQMLVQKPEWTAQLGKAFVADKSAVFASIQRLRTAAQALGNLKTTEQQAVGHRDHVHRAVGHRDPTGEPAGGLRARLQHPDRLRAGGAAPVFRQRGGRGGRGLHGGDHHRGRLGPLLPRAVRVARRGHVQRGVGPSRGLLGRPSGLRRGPVRQPPGLRAGSAERRARQPAAAPVHRAVEPGERQTNAQANQGQRQSTAQANQGQRQSTAQANQATRQASAATSSAGGGQAAAARSSGGGGLSGYQSGASARTQSARGSSSRSASGGGGGRRR